MTGGDKLCAYSLTDLMAEKYRAMLQQVIRNRNRRQDGYDLDRLASAHAFGTEARTAVVSAFIRKMRGPAYFPRRVLP